MIYLATNDDGPSRKSIPWKPRSQVRLLKGVSASSAGIAGCYTQQWEHSAAAAAAVGPAAVAVQSRVWHLHTGYDQSVPSSHSGRGTVLAGVPASSATDTPAATRSNTYIQIGFTTTRLEAE